MADTMRGVNILQTELEKAKQSLQGVNDNIRKLTGRDPTLPNFRVQRRVSVNSSDQGEERPGGAERRIFNLARRGIVQDDPGPRHRPGGAFSRLGPSPGIRGRSRRQDSGDEEEFGEKPTLQSSVVATPREERSRQVSMGEQSGDRRGQARNRRMFGLLLGTLQKFKDESIESKKKTEQRIEIENKLEQKFEQEKEEIIQERRQLYVERRRKQFRIKLLEQKMEMAQRHEEWETETRKLENFILTKIKPHIFYMPKILTEDSEEKLSDTKLAVDAMIVNRRKKLEQEIKEMMSQTDDAADDDHDDEDDDDDNREESGDEKMYDGKENRERERRESESNKEEYLTEREKRDKEREQRDHDRRLKDKQREERRNERVERKKSREDESRGKDRKGHRSRSRDRRHSEKSRSEDNKSRSDKKRKHDKHDVGSSKSKRRSRDEMKVEKKSKVWEPMEDEEEEEFVGSKVGNEGSKVSSEPASIQNRMLDMAGMRGVSVDEGEKDGGIEERDKMDEPDSNTGEEMNAE